MRHLLFAALLMSGTTAPALAQGADMDRRIDVIEREVRALQRQVFPGGNEDFFEPEIRPGEEDTVIGSPTAPPITALTDRVNSLERQLATLTGQVEENSFELRRLSAALQALQAADTPPLEVDTPADSEIVTAGEENVASNEGSEEPSEEPVGQTTTEAPLPEDPGEASYVRGYRMWRDGQYEEARTQLRNTVDSYPGHRFESFARNLLGRAYLDDDKPANATEIFVRNYQELPNGERAADSLFFLGVALTRLNYDDRACLAFDELSEVYGEDLRSTIREQVPAAREAASCSD